MCAAGTSEHIDGLSGILWLTCVWRDEVPRTKEILDRLLQLAAADIVKL